MSEDTGGTYLYFEPDALGTTLGAEDVNNNQDATYEYDSFGMFAGGSGSLPGGNPMYTAFAGGVGYQSDTDTGLIRCGNRYYNPFFGRFLTQDPAKAGMNWYAYCGNDPMRELDPSGLDSKGNVGQGFNAGSNASSSQLITDGEQYLAGMGFWPATGGEYCVTDANGNEIPGTTFWWGPDNNSGGMFKLPAAPPNANIRNNLADSWNERDSLSRTWGELNGLGEIQRLLWFAAHVRTGGDWDYKQQGKPAVKTAPANYDDFGNFNYGANGAALGMTPDQLLDSADTAHGLTWGSFTTSTSDHGDDWIVIGWNWYASNYGFTPIQ